MKRLPILLNIFFFALNISSDTLHIKDIVLMTLKNNFNILVSENTKLKSQNREKLRYGKLLPKIRGELTYSNTQTSSSNKQFKINDGSRYSATLGLNWTLFDGLKMFYAYDSFGKQAHLSSIVHRHKVEVAVVGAVQAFYNLLAIEYLLKATQDQLHLSQSILKKLQSRYELGGSTNRTVLRQKVLVNADSALVAKQKLAVIQARHSLNVICGRSAHSPLIPKYDTVISILQYDGQYWFKQALAHNTGMNIAHINKQIIINELKMTRASRWPTLMTNGTLTQNFIENESTRFMFGLTLSLPIFSGFNTETSIKNAHIDQKNAEIQIEQEKRHLEALIFQQWEKLKNGYKQIDFEKESVNLATKSMEISQEQYLLGGISDIELRDAQLALTQSKVRLQTALFQYSVTKIQLEQLAGVLKF